MRKDKSEKIKWLDKIGFSIYIHGFSAVLIIFFLAWLLPPIWSFMEILSLGL